MKVRKLSLIHLLPRAVCVLGILRATISVSLPHASGLVFSLRAGGVHACCAGLPAGQVWGQHVRGGASKEALPRRPSAGPADGASHQTRGDAGGQRRVSPTGGDVLTTCINHFLIHTCVYMHIQHQTNKQMCASATKAHTGAPMNENQ